MLKKGGLLLALAVVTAGAWLWLASRPLTLAPADSQAATAKLKVSFLDVGQGDAILIQTPAGKKILIDGGESSEKLLAALSSRLSWFDRQLDYVILTHPHADHVKGLNGLFGRYRLSEAVATLVNHSASTYKFWLDNIRDRQIKLTAAAAPQELVLDSGISLKILSPVGSLADQTVDNLNNSSLVLLLTYGRTRWLLMGDAETGVEKTLLSRGEDINAQVLKVAHHGSSGATSPEFLAAVGPQLAVISVGKPNDFGHPHERTLNRLQRAGAKILRTDEQGTIDILSDGQSLELLK